MKHFTSVLSLILLLAATTAFGQFTTKSTQANPAGFLNTSATAQSKQGWIGIGTTTALPNGPLAPVDVRSGITVADSLKVLGNAFVTSKAVIGGSSLPTVDGLKIMNGTIRIASQAVNPLAGTSNKKRLCINPYGKLDTCDNSYPGERVGLDLCTNITGTQVAWNHPPGNGTKTAFFYYEQGSGAHIIVHDPDGDRVCTRAGYACVDGLDNDNDGYTDAADGNCYDNVISGGAVPNGHTVVNKQSAPLSGNTAAINTFIGKITTPTIKLGDRYFKFNPTKVVIAVH